MFWILNLQSWTKVLGHFRVSGAFSNSHRSNPFPHLTNSVARVYLEFFFEFQLCIGWGEGELQVCTVLRGNREMTEKYEYSSTVPRTFVQDCRPVTMSWKSDHVMPLLFQLHRLLADQRIEFKVLLFTYKAMQGLAPQYLSDLLTLRCVVCGLLRNCCLIRPHLILERTDIDPFRFAHQDFGIRCVFT